MECINKRKVIRQEIGVKARQTGQESKNRHNRNCGPQSQHGQRDPIAQYLQLAFDPLQYPKQQSNPDGYRNRPAFRREQDFLQRKGESRT